MVPGREPDQRRLVGRDAQLERAVLLVDEAAAGAFRALLIAGPAGIGKTALADQALAMRPSSVVLRLPCLPLQRLAVPLLPLRAALRSSSAPDALNRACLARLEAGDAIDGLAVWIDEATAAAPVVILVDDLQWADPSTLDVLLYVAATAHHRVALLATQRTEGLPDGHPLHHWLADVLRLPGVDRLALAPLDRAGTAAQLAQLLGGPPHHSLIDDIHDASRGHPYLTSLLVSNLTLSSRVLGPDLPKDLAVAVRRSWHACSPSTREVMSLLALGGRPQTAGALGAVAEELGLSDVEPALREAELNGLVRAGDRERYWFSHPLQAQVLEQGLPAGQRRAWHAAYARHLEASLATGVPPTLELVIMLANHHDQAGHSTEAYRWTLQGADLAAQTADALEQIRLLQRAIELHPQVDTAPETVDGLLTRVKDAAEQAGADSDHLGAVEGLLARLDRREQPVVTSELLVRRQLLRVTTGAGFFDVGEMRSAVELASVDPTSWQYAFALAELAHASAWAADPDAVRYARDAHGLARAARHPTALTYACTARSLTDQLAGRAETAPALAAEGVDAAVSARDWWGFVHATLWECNARGSRYGPAEADLLGRRREQLASLGAPGSAVAKLSAVEAETWLMIGDWPACEERLKVTLGADPGPFADVTARLAAARLAAWRGRVEEADAHLSRADELYADQHSFRGLNFDAVRTTVLLEAGRLEEANRTAMAGATKSGILADNCEWLVPLAARALADQIERVRDSGLSTAEPLARVAELRAAFPDVLSDTGDVGELMARQRVALQSWYEAETLRARRDPAVTVVWSETSRAAAAALLPWVEIYAGWRAAEAFFGQGLERRGEGIRALRDAHALARHMGAGTLEAQLVALARAARVQLDVGDEPPSVRVPLPGLTSREREILEHVVRGATYAEIAAALVISEKTVSSHLSSMLRKTGTSSRVELSLLATRVGRV